VLEECGHEVLVANARKIRLIYANERKTDKVDALRTSLAWRASIEASLPAKAQGRRRSDPLGLDPFPSGVGRLPHAAGQQR
jgi:hypothetical protein